MNSRDDFSQETKLQLAQRVGYMCSYPGCGVLTISSSEEGDTRTSSIGMACHIAAAASGQGSKRYVAEMSPEERKHINNGIWMCYTHGKLIDTDEQRFSIEQLISWKIVAEKVSAMMVSDFLDYKTALKVQSVRNPINNELELLKPDDINNFNVEIIGEAIFQSSIPIVWGYEFSKSIIAVIIEHALNAFIHGKSSYLKIEIENNRITIKDNGTEYNPRVLLTNNQNGGGGLSMRFLFSKYSNDFILTTARNNEENTMILAVIKDVDELYEITPCCIEFDNAAILEGIESYDIDRTCNEVYVILKPHYAASRAVRDMHFRNMLKNETKPIIFIGTHLSEIVIDILGKTYPNSQIIDIGKGNNQNSS